MGVRDGIVVSFVNSDSSILCTLGECTPKIARRYTREAMKPECGDQGWVSFEITYGAPGRRRSIALTGQWQVLQRSGGENEMFSAMEHPSRNEDIIHGAIRRAVISRLRKHKQNNPLGSVPEEIRELAQLYDDWADAVEYQAWEAIPLAEIRSGLYA